MPLSISTNVASLTAQRAFVGSNAALETAFERLSTGKRVNSAVDDAAGLAIGKNLESRVSGLNQAIRNTNDGISMIQIAEGAMDEATSILQRMRDLAVQASNGSVSATEQAYLDTEQEKLATALDAALDQATFNGIDLIDTNASVSLTFQVGADNGDTLAVSVDTLSATSLEVLNADITLASAAVNEIAYVATGGYNLTGAEVFTLAVDGTTYTAASATGGTNVAAALQTALRATGPDSGATVTFDSGNARFVVTWAGQHSDTYSLTSTGDNGNTTSGATTINQQGVDSAATAINTIDRALDTIASDRATLGAIQAQMESTVRNLANVAENTAAATGRIMDTDYAAETANLTKAQILQQAATSILAQANAQPQSVLTLLQ